MYQSYIFLAQGFEETEALTVVDVLRRASVEIATVSVTRDKAVTGAHGITVLADKTFGEADLANAQWLICPGGMPGSTNLHEFAPLDEALKAHNSRGGFIAAICAAPAVVLAPAGVLKGKKATCYPGFEDALAEGGATATFDRVVCCDNVITANGPATAMDFALAIVESTCGKEVASNVAAGLLRK